MQRVSGLESTMGRVAKPRKPGDRSARELVAACLAGDGGGWDEFLRRYTPFIKKQIVKALLSRCEFELARDPDIVLKIYYRVFEKLYLGKALADLKDPDKILAWLKTVTVNKTFDWLASRRSIRRLADEQARRVTVSIQAPVGQDGALTVEDVLPDPGEANGEAAEELRQVLRDFAALSEKERWALRLKVLFYSPLEEAEIESLAGFLGRPAEDVRRALDTITDRLVQEAGTRECLQSQAGRSCALMEELRGRERGASRRGTSSGGETGKRESVLSKRARRTEVLIRGAGQLIDPSNEEIARILGISPEKAGHVGVLVYRARQALRKSRKAREGRGERGKGK